MSDDANHWQPVARLDEIDNPGSHAFQVDAEPLPIMGFVVRRGENIFGYENVCPHAGRNLNWGPHRFLTPAQAMIICAAPGAVFAIGSGEGADGPCIGESLRRVPVRVVDGVIEADVSGLALS